ncbi:uncharacterized protein PAC_12417 [Phialocephala subalpina]|uniref:Uncharacterized protein n=1 Tax=Phialocephala subalpina TaxID=576137 RepID=A0A1L7XBT9_9HELO|nr:uncharacterized protein PAC_12417 [Phialocephala subalpina]
MHAAMHKQGFRQSQGPGLREPRAVAEWLEVGHPNFEFRERRYETMGDKIWVSVNCFGAVLQVSDSGSSHKHSSARHSRIARSSEETPLTLPPLDVQFFSGAEIEASLPWSSAHAQDRPGSCGGLVKDRNSLISLMKAFGTGISLELQHRKSRMPLALLAISHTIIHFSQTLVHRNTISATRKMLEKPQNNVGEKASTPTRVYNNAKPQDETHRRLNPIQDPTAYQQERSAPNASSSVAWSHTETQGYGSYDEGKVVADDNKYQLQQWAYEASHAGLTFTERLQQSKWETGSRQ